ncbi:hypothetical protein, conserved [Eimeria praecox]|uniref:Uncharacterized protein n=1 Tax=Eimeria praecox TaxID=51316 RepID=U6G4P5_9EIME|nr:hypothetical protein, conserved [Eimeria praecox]
MLSDLGINACNADRSGSEDGASESFSAYASSPLTFRSCWGFSAASRQAAAVVPVFSRSALRFETLQDYMVVYCLGSWCIVRGPSVGAEAERDRALPTGFVHLTSVSDPKLNKRDASQSRNATTALRSAPTGSPPQGWSSPTYTERVFQRHCNKVNLLAYSHALNLCFSAEQQTASKGAGPLPVCRLWSPHTLEEVALVQLPSRHDVMAAHFSHNGSLLFLLLSDPQHSLAVYFHVSQVVQRQLSGDANSQSPAELPVLQATHVTPCTRSLLNGLTLESMARSGGQGSFNRGRSRWRCASGVPANNLYEGEAQSGNPSRHSSGEGALIRFATFGLGHLRLWCVNSERPSQLPSHKSLCISRLGGDRSQTGSPPEATACSFLPSGDIIAALADRRIVVFRGLAPLRSVSMPSCSSKIVLLQPLQKSLLLLVAQEGLVQLLPLTALASKNNGSAPQAMSATSGSSSSGVCTQNSQRVGQVGAARPNTATGSTVSQRFPLKQQTAQRRQQGAGIAATPRTLGRLRSPAPRSPAAAAPFATGSVHAPTRTPRSTYGDSVGRPWSSCNRPLSLSRSSSAAGSRRGFARGLSKTATLHRSPSAVSRTSTRSSICRNSPQGGQQQKCLSKKQQSGTLQRAEAALSTLRELRPKRSLTTQQVAVRHLHNKRDNGGSLWLPLHSSQVVAAYWCEPLLLLSTRTQIMLLDALHLSEEASLVLQDRPLGSLDVSALLSLPASFLPAEASLPLAQPNQNPAQELQHQQVLQLPPESSSVVVTGGRCCVGGELRLWEFHSNSRSTLPFYFKSPITAVAAAATKGEAQGLIAAGTEEGNVVLLALQQNAQGVLEPPLVSLDRQITPRCISALGLDGGRGIMAVASTAGHDQLLVTGPNAPPSVFSIPEGRLLVSSLTEDAKALDSFAPLSLPAPLVIGPEGASRSSDDALHVVLHETFAKGSRSLRVLPAPMLLTACIGSSKLCLAYESERRILLGMQVPCSISKQQQAPQELSQLTENTTSEGAESVKPGGPACAGQQKPIQTSRFHRGAGLASLFRDLGRFPRSGSRICAPAANPSMHYHSQLSWNSDAPSETPEAKCSEDSVIQFASVKLPHGSPPTALLYYTEVDPYDVPPEAKARQREPSVNFLSLAAEGYILSWSYNVSHCSTDAAEPLSTAYNPECPIPTSHTNNSKRESEQPIQPCCRDGKGNLYSTNEALLPECVQTSSAISLPDKNSIDQAGFASGTCYNSQVPTGTVGGHPKEVQHAGSATSPLPPASAASCDDSTQERA